MNTIRIVTYNDREKIVFKGELYDDVNRVIPKEIVRHEFKKQELSNDLRQWIENEIKQQLSQVQ